MELHPHHLQIKKAICRSILGSVYFSTKLEKFLNPTQRSVKSELKKQENMALYKQYFAKGERRKTLAFFGDPYVTEHTNPFKTQTILIKKAPPPKKDEKDKELSLIHISEPTRPY